MVGSPIFHAVNSIFNYCRPDDGAARLRRSFVGDQGANAALGRCDAMRSVAYSVFGWLMRGLNDDLLDGEERTSDRTLPVQ